MYQSVREEACAVRDGVTHPLSHISIKIDKLYSIRKETKH